MAHFCYASVTDPLSWLQVGLPDVIQIGLWGGGPGGEELEIVVQGPPIVTLSFPAALKSFPVAGLRVFEMMAVGGGRTSLVARVPRTGASFAAPLQVTVGASGLNTDPDFRDGWFYHGTTLDSAKNLMTTVIAPFTVAEAQLMDLDEYTDFGKGFYTHPEESKQLALQWAKRKAKRADTEWGIVRFILTRDELNDIRRSPDPLHFPDKLKTRPSNAPKLFDGKPALWIEFVEFNKHVRRSTIQRPKDNDWTGDYSWMRGPMWGRPDSNLPGAPGPPERYHQINWGLRGLKGLNADAARRRRFLFTKHNEGNL
jgi:hypothetical protein